MENDLNPTTEQSSKPNSGTSIVFLSMAGLYVFVCLCLGMFVFVYTQQTPALLRIIASETPMPSATPVASATPIVREPALGDQVIRSDFSDNARNWRSKWNDGTVVIKDGNLILSVAGDNAIAMSECSKCPYLHNKFYIEADFSTDQAINDEYGLAFNLRNNHETGYVFEINAVKQTYLLYERDRTDQSNAPWRLRFSNHSPLIKEYPEVNKLAVSFDKDVIELYINQNLVERYQDTGTDITYGEFAFHVDGNGFNLIVDNLFAYGQ